jgi:hypothetical protein
LASDSVGWCDGHGRPSSEEGCQCAPEVLGVQTASLHAYPKCVPDAFAAIRARFILHEVRQSRHNRPTDPGGGVDARTMPHLSQALGVYCLAKLRGMAAPRILRSRR